MSFRILRVVRSCLPATIGILLATAPLIAASPVWASSSGSSSVNERQLTLDDVLRLHTAGLSDNIIASEILVTGSVFKLSADDLLGLKAAGFSDELIQFLVDTGLEDADRAVGEESSNESDAWEEPDAWDDEGEEYAGEWYNEIGEEPAPTYFVTLNYSYSDWWYGSYWSDYWYYDYHYYPYQYSYSWYYGAWYPGWYSYRYCYLPPYWGYRSHYYAHWGYHWGIDTCGDYYASGGYYTADARHTRQLSDTKYKTGRGASGKRLYADVGLKVRDVDRLTKTRTRVDRKVDRTPKDRLVVAELRKQRTPGGDRIHRPIKTTQLTGTTKRPITVGKPVKLDGRTRLNVDRTRTPTTRRPALDKPPKPRVRTLHTVDKPRSSDRKESRTVDKPPVDDRRRPRAVTRPAQPKKTPVVKSKPKPKPVEKPTVRKKHVEAQPKKVTPSRPPQVTRPAEPPPKVTPAPRPAPQPKKSPPPTKKPPRARPRGR